MKARALAIALMFALLAQLSPSQPAAKIYATQFHDTYLRVYSCNLDGSGVNILTMPMRAKCVAVDWTRTPHQLYVGLAPATSNGKIIRCNADGTNQQDVVTDVVGISDIELDLTNRRVYWTQNTFNDDRVYHAGMDSLNKQITQIYATTTPMRDLWGLALDVRNRRLWVTERGGTCYDSYVRRMSMSGGSVTAVLYPVCNPHDIEYFDGRIYWGDAGGIISANPDGTGIDTLVAGTNNDGLAIDGTMGAVFWVTYGIPAVWRVNMDKNNRVSILNGIDGLSHVETDYNPSAVSIAPRAEIPVTWELAQNYPNPFNPGTTIGFGLPERADVLLTVYNLLGQEVAMLVHGTLEAGQHEIRFEGDGLPNGVYFYRLTGPGFTQTRRMLLLK